LCVRYIVAKLNANCRDIIGNPAHCILVSSASAWENATKNRIGKVPETKQLVAQYPQVLNQAKLIELPITAAHGLRAGGLPILHRDPFDRMIMTQAEIEKSTRYYLRQCFSDWVDSGDFLGKDEYKRF
jgi:PIN domain nuclease of toxin-antitoxin system